FVAWEAYNKHDAAWHIYGRHYAANGVATAPEFLISQRTSSGGDASVASLKDGGYIATFRGDGGILGRRYSASGDPLGTQFVINTDMTHPKYESSVAALKNDGFITTWLSDLQDGSGAGVYGQRYSAP